ncbi:50S ribosomal protein L18e [uncultured archaeon]|nr:50S ribosomal protein L18e [uncultured archaeon]
MKPTGPTNPLTQKLIVALQKQSRKEKAAIWADVADRLAKSTRRIPAVNLSKLERFCEKGDTILIPGKLLSQGAITKPVTIGAFKISAAGKHKVEKAGGKVMTIQELMKRNAKGSKVRIMG